MATGGDSRHLVSFPEPVPSYHGPVVIDGVSER